MTAGDPGRAQRDPSAAQVGRDDEPGVLWGPERLRLHDLDDAQLAGLHYVVLEEMVDGVASLLAWTWPLVDGRGRLFWRPEQQQNPVELSVPLGRLTQQVYRAGKLKREPRCGDTFAASLDLSAVPEDGSLIDDLRPVLPDGVYDLSAEAHQAAKLSYQGALAGIRPEPTEDDDAVLLTGRPAPYIRLARPRRLEDGDR